MSEQDTTHDLANLFHAHDKVARRSAECEAATAKLELERIHERMYELRSQHEPLNTLTEGDRVQRQHIIDSIFYVVIGRFPKKGL